MFVEAVMEHLRKQLGESRSSSSSSSPGGAPLPFGVVEIPNQPMQGALTYATAGLSSTTLKQPDGSLIRQELLLCTHGQQASDKLIQLLFFVGDRLRQEGEALTAGEVLDLNEPVVPGSTLTALFFWSPLYFPEPAWRLETVEPPPILFAWAIPISHEEQLLVAREGPERLDELLAQQDPDLLDLTRRSVRLTPP